MKIIANKIYKIGLHKEAKMRTDCKFSDEFEVFKNSKALVFDSKTSAKNAGCSALKKSSQHFKTEFLLKDGSVVVREGNIFVCNDRHSVNPQSSIEQCFYMQTDEKRIAFWKKYAKIHLEKREAFAKENGRILKSVWLYETCGA